MQREEEVMVVVVAVVLVVETPTAARSLGPWIL
jgi:hypothetical protein